MENQSDAPTSNEDPHVEKPQKEHLWLKQLLGEWVSAGGGTEDGAEKYRGTEHVKALGDLWVVGEGTSEMPDGGKFDMRITLGFDPKRGRFVGSWVGSTMTFLWVYDGELDASGKKLTLHSEGPSFTDPKALGNYQDIIEFISPDERTLTSRTQEKDGTWNEFMKITYRRK